MLCVAFPSKKKHLIGKIELNQWFDQHDQWSENEITERGKYLASIAVQLWPDLGEPGDSQLISDDEVVGTIPAAFTLCGQRFPATRWREVGYKTCQNLYSLVDKGTFDNVINTCSGGVGRDKNRFREPKELSDGIYVELHVSAKQAFAFCKKAVEAAGLTVKDWTIELKDNQLG